MLSIVISNQFKKDLKLAKKRGLKINHLKEVIDTLANSEPLNEKYRDHDTTGTKPDYPKRRSTSAHHSGSGRIRLLIYRVENRELELFLFRTGSHSDLF